MLGVYVGSYPVFVMLGYNHRTFVPNGDVWIPLRPIYGWWWISFAGGCIMISALTWSRFQLFLSWKPVAFVGRISFGIYLTHYMVLIAVDVLAMPSLLKTMSRDDAVFLTLFTLILPLTLSLAYVFTLFVDSAGVEFSKFVVNLVFFNSPPQTEMVSNKSNSSSNGGINGFRTRFFKDALISKKVVVWSTLYLVFIVISFIPSPHGTSTCTSLYG
jgi:peptidoglycan/LPS O-acetylase OafA/YrhL